MTFFVVTNLIACAQPFSLSHYAISLIYLCHTFTNPFDYMLLHLIYLVTISQIASMLLIFLIFRLLFSKNSQSCGTTISDFCDNCRKLKFLLPQKETICASAFTQVRSKLNKTKCNVLNKSIISACEEETNRWHNQRIFAIDGSKINLQHEPIKRS